MTIEELQTMQYDLTRLLRCYEDCDLEVKDSITNVLDELDFVINVMKGQ